jgi:hypothetical protein
MAVPFSRRLWSVSTTVAGIMLMAAAIAAFSTWLPYAGREELDNRLAGAMTALLRMGASAAFVGGSILALLYFFRDWPTASKIAEDRTRTGISPGLIPFGVYLAGLPFLFVVAGAPAVQFLSTHRSLWNDAIGGFGLMVPLTESVMTLVLFSSAIAVVGLFFSRSRLFPKAFLTLVAFQLGFVLMAFAAINLGSAGAESLAAMVPTIQEHHTAVRIVARNQTWLFIASAIWATFLILSPRTAAWFAAEPDTWPSARSGLTTVHLPSSVTDVVATEAALAPVAESAPRYAVRANYVAGFFGGALEAVDLNSPAILSATLGPMTGHIQVYSSGRVVKEIVKATRNRYFTPWPAYQVAAAESTPLGGMRKVSRTEWRILDASGREIGSIDQGAVSLGRAKYRAQIGNTPVCTFAWSNVIMPELVLDCSPNAERLLDGRFALACALALFVDVCPSA